MWGSWTVYYQDGNYYEGWYDSKAAANQFLKYTACAGQIKKITPEIEEKIRIREDEEERRIVSERSRSNT